MAAWKLKVSVEWMLSSWDNVSSCMCDRRKFYGSSKRASDDLTFVWPIFKRLRATTTSFITTIAFNGALSTFSDISRCQILFLHICLHVFSIDYFSFHSKSILNIFSLILWCGKGKKNPWKLFIGLNQSEDKFFWCLLFLFRCSLFFWRFG